MQTTKLKLLAIVGSVSLVSGCSTILPSSVQGGLDKVVSPELSAYWNLRPTWVSEPIPDDDKYFYCYAEVPYSRGFVYNFIPTYSAIDRAIIDKANRSRPANSRTPYGWDVPRSQEIRVRKALNKEVRNCLIKKFGRKGEILAGWKYSFELTDNIVRHSQFWFDGYYGYMKINMNIQYLENVMVLRENLWKGEQAFKRYLDYPNIFPRPDRRDQGEASYSTFANVLAISEKGEILQYKEPRYAKDTNF